MTTAITTDQMLSELVITFPPLRVRLLREFGTAYAGAEGVWTGQDPTHLMPDGLPIFDDLAAGEPPYDGTVHGAFEAWMANRAWYVERYDDTTYLLRPIDPADDAMFEEWHTAWAELARLDAERAQRQREQGLAVDGLPF